MGSDKTSFIVRSAAELGQAARQQRKRQQVSITEVAPLINLGPRFISEVERGKDTAEIGKVLQLLDGLGLAVLILPKSVAQKLDRSLRADPEAPL